MDIIKKIIKKAQDYAASIQNKEGYWRGILSSNNAIEAEYIFLLFFLEMADPLSLKKIVQRLLNCQQEDGGWNMFYQAPSELNTTVECYFALKLCDIDANTPEMTRAREFILASGGIEECKFFTKIWLALFGQIPWKQLPHIPLEIISWPKWFFVNIYDFAAWARVVIVAFSIILFNRPVCNISEKQALLELQYTSTPRSKFAKNIQCFSLKKLLVKLLLFVLSFIRISYSATKKELLIKKAESWILAHREKDGSFSGLAIASLTSMIALKTIGYKAHEPILSQCLLGFKREFITEYSDFMRVDATNSPIWDTALMIIALLESGISVESPIIKKGVIFLLEQKMDASENWTNSDSSNKPTGWAFQFENKYYPDYDDTAIVIVALSKCLQLSSPYYDLKNQISETISHGFSWLLTQNSKNGGWAAFDKNNSKAILAHFPFVDYGEIIDPPSVDVTAHVLEALGNCAYKITTPIIQQAITYIFQEQESDGSWFGRWGVNYIYGTSAVLVGLAAINYNMNDFRIQLACDWLLGKQNEDGGWGETCFSYAIPTEKGQGPSTASQTAWALLGLLACGFNKHEQVKQGIQYIIDHINKDGTWDEAYFTGCGFPGYLTGAKNKISFNIKNVDRSFRRGNMLHYDLYRHYWPLRALGLYYSLLDT